MFNSLKIFWLNFSNFEGGRKFSNTEIENKQNVHYSSIHPNSDRVGISSWIHLCFWKWEATTTCLRSFMHAYGSHRKGGIGHIIRLPSTL